MDSKNFLKAPLSPIYTYIKGGKRAEKNAIFFGKIFQKVSKNAFFGLFFQSFACGAESLSKTDLLSALGELGKPI